LNINDVTLDTPLPGERCNFHPGCCDPDDMTCPGCGAPAVKTLVLTSPKGIRRMPFCDDHSAGTAEVMQAAFAAQAEHPDLAQIVEREHGKNRRRALLSAVYAEHGLPHEPVMVGEPAACQHDRPGDDECHCRFTPDEYEGNVRLIEDAVADRILRNAQRFYDWIAHDLTPQHKQDYELRLMQDGDDTAR
jgi:hypothetical protein